MEANVESALLYLDEHINCNNFLHNVETGFTYHEEETGSRFDDKLDPTYNHLLFLLEGVCTLSCNDFKDRTIQGGEMILIPRAATSSGQVTQSAKWLQMTFVLPHSGCDRLVLESYKPFCKEIDYDFQPLAIREPILKFIDLMLFYMRSGMNCAHLHAMKHAELFFLLRGFYKKEEIATLFYPLIGKPLNFREQIEKWQDKEHSLTQLAEELHMSQIAFLRRFKEEFNETYFRWETRRKCDRILADMAIPNITIKEIMTRHGFYAAPNFNRFCKTKFGYTPSELLKRYGTKTYTVSPKKGSAE